jgi:peptidyl-prolyl cis-trans isomerase SurA
MKWLRLAALALTAAGCGSERSTVDAGQLPAPAVARLQQSDPDPAGPSLRPVADPPAGSGLPKAGPEGFVTSRVRALVNGRPILDDELREASWAQLRYASQMPEPQRSERMKDILKQELDKLIDREVIIGDAEDRLKSRAQVWAKLTDLAEKEFDKQLKSMQQRANVQNEDEFREVLAGQGMSMPGLKRQIERNFIASEYMRSRIFPIIERIGHNEILAYYQQHPGEFQIEDRVKWQDIFIDADSPQFTGRAQAQQFAEQIADDVRHGGDFVKLSAQYNMGDSKDRNGDGLGQKQGEIKPFEMESMLFAMKDGEVEVAELPTGFHVVRLVQREHAGQQPLDEKTQAEIHRKLQNLVADREYKRIVKELRRKATIQILVGE